MLVRLEPRGEASQVWVYATPFLAVALTVLGVGWNFLFLARTNLLPRGYRPAERYRVQSFNDFTIFSVQAIVSLSSGWFLFRFGWQGLLWTGAVLLGVYLVMLIRSNGLSEGIGAESAGEAGPGTEAALRQVDFDD